MHLRRAGQSLRIVALGLVLLVFALPRLPAQDRTLDDVKAFADAWRQAHDPAGQWDGSYDLNTDGKLDQEDAALLLEELLGQGGYDDPYPVLLADDTVDRYIAALKAADVPAALADFVAWLEALPEVDFAAVGPDDTSVLAQTPTGERYGFVLGRLSDAVEPGAAGASRPRARPSARVPPVVRPAPVSTAEIHMPATSKAGAFFGCGPGFTNSCDLVADYLSDVGFLATSGNLTLTALQHLEDYDVLLLDSHGALHELPNGDWTYGVSTVHSAGDAAINTQFAADITAGRVWKSSVVWDLDQDPPEHRKVFWAGLEFINHYNGSLPTNNLTVIAACYSDRKPFIHEEFHNLGCRAYVGWSSEVKNSFVASATQYFFERLLMKNVAEPFYPPMHPLTVDEVIEVMGNPAVDLLEDPQTYARLRYYINPAADVVAIRPGITSAFRVGTGYGDTVLRLGGHFGPDEGEVKMDNNSLSIVSWTEDMVDVQCPLAGTGKVVVHADNGTTSNAALFASYNLDLTVNVVDPMYSGHARVLGTDRRFAGAFFNPWDLGIFPIVRGLMTREGTVSWDLQGLFIQGDMRVETNDQGQQQLSGQSVCFNINGEDVSMHDNVSFMIQQQFTNTDNGQSWTQASLCAIGTTGVATSAAYNQETGVVSAGSCNWTWATAYGNRQLSMTWDSMRPFPSVDVTDPR